MGILCECCPYRMWWLETLMPLNSATICMINNLDDVEVGQELEFGSNG
jgi:hypothetical protein